MADPLAVSAEIGAKGIAATEARLAALADPTPEDLFALAGLRFLSGVEGVLQLRWEVGWYDEELDAILDLPFLSHEVAPNPQPRKATGADLTRLLEDLHQDMEQSRAALARIGDRDFAFELALDDLWFDINGDGKREPAESLGSQFARFGGIRFEDEVPPLPVVRFDTADGAWLSAYTNLISANALVLRAYDPAPAFDRLTADTAAMKATIAVEYGAVPDVFERSLASALDQFAILLETLRQEPDAALTRAAHGHLLQMIAENRRFWGLVVLETDDDREWIPNAKQRAALGIAVPEGTPERWQAVLAEGERILKGEELIPHWRYGEGHGINIQKLFENPPRIDLILMIQGTGFLPYVEKGEVATGQAWQEFQWLVGGDSLMFSFWLN